MESTRDRVPPHLRWLVVEQDCAEYTEIDQAVWRFILLNLQTTLQQTAHPAYTRGLAASGIPVERIPRIDEMDAALGRFGWGAVAVDGFIPPRAFQELQGLRILPIAATVRTLRHLAYTPAPDIVHEAAGHAPILVDPAYAAYVEAIGRAGVLAFRLPSDERVYRAVYRLSEIKEDPSAPAPEVARAEGELEQAVAGAELSESGRLARLYWWTAEYGLVGTPARYALYGAGLLSSLGESHSCHAAGVQKRPLDAGCMDVAYDITQPQPQLFVAESFEHLGAVLREAAGSLAAAAGGTAALEAAKRSEELCTVVLGGGRARAAARELSVEGAFRAGSRVSGVIDRVHVQGDRAVAVSFRGGATVSAGGDAISTAAEPFLLPLGAVEGPAPEPGREGAWSVGPSRIRGRVERVVDDGAGGPAVAVVAGLHVETPLGAFAADRSALPLGAEVDTALPGAFGREAGRPTDFPGTKVPRRRHPDARDLDLLRLYERAIESWRSRAGSAVVPIFEAIHRQIGARHPGEWLLRWNLLESLMKIGEDEALQERLQEELTHLEVRYARLEPIATGLRTLRETVRGGGG